MDSLVQGKGSELTMNDVEKSLEGNICRCTGYRPIMDAFKTFAKDAAPELKSQCIDIEVTFISLVFEMFNNLFLFFFFLFLSKDLVKCKVDGQCRKSSAACSGKCQSASAAPINGQAGNGIMQLDNWYRPDSLEQLVKLLAAFNNGTKYRLVAGNTATGKPPP